MRLLPLLFLLFIARVPGSHECLARGAPDESGPRPQHLRLRTRRGHLLRRLRAVRGAEQPDSRARRRAALDFTHRDLVGPSRVRHDFRSRTARASTRFVFSSVSPRRGSSRASCTISGGWFPEQQRARAIASFMAAVLLASTIGGPLGGALLSLRRTARSRGVAVALCRREHSIGDSRRRGTVVPHRPPLGCGVARARAARVALRPPRARAARSRGFERVESLARVDERDALAARCRLSARTLRVAGRGVFRARAHSRWAWRQ